MAQGAMRADGHAMAASNAALIPALHHCRIAVFPIEGNNDGRADIGADAVAVTTLGIDL
jgi:hypothetical protein